MERIKNWIAKKVIQWLLSSDEGSKIMQTFEHLEAKISETNDVLRKRTDISVDHAIRGRDMCYIFVSGRYNKGDFVQLYSVRVEDFRELVDLLRKMQRHATVKRVDRDPLSYSGFIKRELGR